MTDLIPRSILFGNPERTALKISRDGAWLSWLAPVEGVLNLHLAPREQPDEVRVLTRDRGRGIVYYLWAADHRHILYLQDENGDENLHCFALDVTDGAVRDLTPLDGVQAQPIAISPRHPHQVLLGINHREPQLHDVYRVDLRSGERDLVFENPGVVGFSADHDLRLRSAIAFREDGGQRIVRIDDDALGKVLFEIDPEDALSTGVIDCDPAGEHLLLLDSRGRDTVALVRCALADGTCEELVPAGDADIDSLIRDPLDGRVVAVSHNRLRRRWRALDEALSADLETLRAEGGELEVLSLSDDLRWWACALYADDGPVRFGLYDREARAFCPCFVNQPALAEYQLAAMESVEIPTRDGLSMTGYLTRPRQPAAEGASLVLWVHGGPWARDTWGYNPVHQWLADRGHAVLAVNYRGSTGFGKSFTNAGDREWSGRMHEDLCDAMDWAVARGVAEPERVAIGGGSYGGYAALVGVTFTPERFACAVDIVGPSNLITLLENAPPYWAPMMPMMGQRLGDPGDPADREELWQRSPLSRVEAIRRPLLIGQGANDPRVTRVESEQIVTAMRERGLPVTYACYADEGHGFQRPENRLSFFALMEAFLARHLGGRFQPLTPEDLAGSSLAVEEGAEHVPGLEEALARVAR